VPSAVIRSEFNYLINPLHPRFGELVIGPPEPFRFDSRLQKIGPVPNNAIIVKRAPQLELLIQTSVCINPCGIEHGLRQLRH
jgi:hypothetical protein